MSTRPLSIALVASPSARAGDDSPLIRFVRRFEPFFRDVLGARLVIEGDTCRSLRDAGLLAGYGGVECLPAASEGGIVLVTAELVGGMDGSGGLDWVVHLLDPTDSTALYPETAALKRQCVVHDRPYLTTEAAASEWCALEWARAVDEGAAPGTDMPALIEHWVRPRQVGRETIALVAHDALKIEMLDFARRHRPLLSAFARRLGTGTTGTLLNGRLPERLRGGEEAQFRRLGIGDGPGEPWVEAGLSGPKGGDAQIAREILHGRCRRVVFLENPHVAREHEADIQLLERATRFSAQGSLCLNSRGTAERWAENMARILAATEA